MATAILPPQNLLRRRFHHGTLAPHPLSAPNPSSHRNRHACSDATARRRKRSPPEPRSSAVGGVGGGSRSRRGSVEYPAANSKLVMGQVKILKRGETLSEFQKKERSRDREITSASARQFVMKKNGGCSEDFDLVLGSTGRIGPDPDTVTKQIRACKGFEKVAGGFAGASCSVSPPPSSVPIPGFLGKKNMRIV